MTSTRIRMVALAGVVALTLSACGNDGGGDEGAGSETAAAGGTVEVEDNNGPQTVASPPQSVVATDNRTFETLDAWGIELSAAAVSLMPETISYTQDENIIDLGSHREPDLEAVVAAEPDLIINGQRFAQFHDDFVELAPDATVLELDPRDGEPFDEELKRQVTVLGEIFEKQAEAEELATGLDESIEAVNSSWDSEDTVMGVIVSGGEIGYVAPSTGRTIGPMFDLFDWTPALEVEDGSEDHQGDDISVEAIAESNPDWIVVMDRDAGTSSDEGSQPAAEVIEESEALANVPAIEEGNVIYMPDDTYTNEGIQTYTEFFEQLAEQLGSDD